MPDSINPKARENWSSCCSKAFRKVAGCIWFITGRGILPTYNKRVSSMAREGNPLLTQARQYRSHLLSAIVVILVLIHTSSAFAAAAEEKDDPRLGVLDSILDDAMQHN